MRSDDGMMHRLAAGTGRARWGTVALLALALAVPAIMTNSMNGLAIAEDQTAAQSQATSAQTQAASQAARGQKGTAQPLSEKEIEERACVKEDVDYDADTDKNSHPAPEAPADKALVVVIRPTKMGNKIQTKLSVDGKFIGLNRGNNYFFFPLEAGDHYFCSKSENRSVLALNVEAGKTYYLQQKIKMGLLKARNELVVLDEAEGKRGLEKCNPSSWKVEEDD